MIAEAFPCQKQRQRILGSEMTYVEVGQGDPIVVLHKRDIPGAVVRFLGAGHFAVETHAREIADSIRDFLT